jgi:hypothetical protein
MPVKTEETRRGWLWLAGLALVTAVLALPG